MNNKFKFFAVFTAVHLLISFMPAKTAAADIKQVQVLIDGRELDTGDGEAVIKESRTMVPVRSIFEALGAEVFWSETERKITARKDETEIELVIGKNTAKIDGKTAGLDAAPVIADGRTLVPARFVSEAFGYKVEWKEARQSVYIWTINEGLLASLRNFESLADEELIKWLASLYDVKSGGFYFAASARDTAGFGPTIEGTNWVLDILKTIGIIPRKTVCPDDVYIPDKFRRGILDFLIPLQEEEDGYFYEPQFGKSVSETKRTRDTVAADMIEYFGGKCKYLTPSQRVSAQGTPKSNEKVDLSTLAEHFHSEENFRKWVYALDMENSPYESGSQLSTAYNMAVRLGYDDIVRDYLIETQNKNTGLWGKDADTTGIDGALKVSYYFSRDTEPYPNIDKMLGSVLSVIDSEDISANIGMARNWNRLAVIDKAMNSYAEIPPEVKTKVEESLVNILNRTAEKLKKYRQPDFGYSNYMDGSTVTASDATVSLGLKEGDTNGTTLAFDCFRTALSLAGAGDIPFEKTEEYRELFWELIENAAPNQKPEPDMDFHFNFDSGTPTVSVRGKEFGGYVIGDKIYFYVKAEEARSADTTRNTGVGKENFDDETAKMPVLKKNGEIADTPIEKIKDGVYKINIDGKEKELYVMRTVLQLYHPFEGELRNDAPSVTGLPKWHTGVLGPGTWNWMSQRYDGNTVTEIVYDSAAGSRVFKLRKVLGTNDASFRSSYGAPQSGIKTVISKFKIKVDHLSAFFEEDPSRGIYFGGIGGDGAYTGRHALGFSREGKPPYDKTMDVWYMKTPSQSEKRILLPNKLSLNQWYDITMIYENEKNDDGTFTGIFKVFIDGNFIFETSCIYENDLNLNTSHTGIYGFFDKNRGPAEYTISIDDYDIEFIKEEDNA